MGRAAELRLLDELLEEMQAGEPVTAIVCGEAGSGKTRLVGEVAAEARGRRMRALMGSCTMVGATSLAFAPFADALRTVVQELALEGTDREHSLAPRFPPGGHLGGHDGDTRSPGARSTGGVRAQLGLFEEVLDTLERAAVPSGLLVVIEDLHWADPSSLGLFEFLSAQPAAACRSRWWEQSGPTSPTTPGSWPGWLRCRGARGPSGSIWSPSAGRS